MKEITRKQGQIGYGDEGRCLTYQDSFPPTTRCVKCGKVSRFALSVIENGTEFACRAHKDEKSVFWLHDAAAFAIYLCTDYDCAEATTLWNQA